LLRKRSIKLWVFHFVTLCLTSLLITIVSSFFLSNPILSTIQGQTPDTTPPDIVVPQDIVEEATGPNGAQVSFEEASAQDDVDGPVDVSCDHDSGEIFPIAETSITCTAQDSAGNGAEDYFTISVEDTTAPVITLPQDITKEATGPNGAQVSFEEASAQDDVDGPVDVSCNYNSGYAFPVGDTTVQCSATDEAGNEGTASFRVTVNPPPTDTTPPVITVPQDITKEAAGQDSVQVTYAVTAQDNVDGAAILEEDGSTVTQGDVGGDITLSCDPASGFMFPVGDTTVQCSATDEAGNEGTASFRVTANDAISPTTDTTPPVITVPDDITEQATSPDGATVLFEVSAQDNVDGPVGVTCDRNSGGTFPVSETVVTCTAEDSAGNRAQEPFLITVGAPDGVGTGGSEVGVGEGGGTIVAPGVGVLPWSTNVIPLIVLASIGIVVVVVGILLVKYYNDRKNSRSRRIKISPSSIVEIRSKGGIRE
jgi:hypothetical protein